MTTLHSDSGVRHQTVGEIIGQEGRVMAVYNIETRWGMVAFGLLLTSIVKCGASNGMFIHIFVELYV